jgi:hypothetical protein
MSQVKMLVREEESIVTSIDNQIRVNLPATLKIREVYNGICTSKPEV